MNNGSADLLIELVQEEIPARMQSRAADDLARLFAEAFAAADLPHALFINLSHRAIWRSMSRVSPPNSRTNRLKSAGRALMRRKLRSMAF